MCAWNSTWPDGTKSVKANQPTGAQNTTYIETEMVLDHFWNEDANNDGHHRYVEMPKIDDTGRAVDANKDPTALNTNQSALIYSRTKTATESTASQFDEPYAYTQDGANNHYMQLGFRCMVHFTGGSTPAQGAIQYYHNIELQSASPKGVVRNSEGLYTITFANPLPSANYIVYGSAIRTGSTNQPYLSVISKTAANVRVQFQYSGNTLADPTTIMIAICGG